MRATSFRLTLAAVLAAAIGCGGGSAQSGNGSAAARLVTGCGVQFEQPEGWELAGQPLDSAGTCVIRLDLADTALRDSAHLEGEYGVRIETLRMTFDSLVAYAGFVKRDSAWIVLGRQGTEAPALALTRAGLRGVQGIAVTGCFRKSGGVYAGLCDTPRAAVAIGELGVLLDAGPSAEGAFSRVLASLHARSGN